VLTTFDLQTAHGTSLSQSGQNVFALALEAGAHVAQSACTGQPPQQLASVLTSVYMHYHRTLSECATLLVRLVCVVREVTCAGASRPCVQSAHPTGAASARAKAE
jgi:hypothetical protein